MSLKEEISNIHIESSKSGQIRLGNRIADQILSLLKLEPLTDEEIRATHPYWEDLSDNAVKRVRIIAQAQLDKIRKYNGL